MDNAKAQVLTLTLRSSNKDEDRHAVVRFPQSYEEAVATALRLFGPYMSNADASNIVLKYRIFRDDHWVWADFESDCWPLVVRPGGEVGVFEKRSENAVASKALFWRGPIYLVFGETKGSKTTWSRLNLRNPELNTTIDRPASYAAVEMTKDCLKYRDTMLFWKPVTEPGKTLTFYVFSDSKLTSWMPFPSSASADDDAWKAIVPEAPGVMGVIAT
ncbi:hypothetical protein B0H15DRAFT_594610 [Mycena belliarum]|uniref:Uncharacterized protein n=1 Tax=Mycena belliarum TaxID=1033014 RepID=A0AAD6TT12_9AGAR|nr:hypothetical protein B0H15DRAFT_594610 [Mycena belliae]